MKAYFVRHGESEQNSMGVHQSGQTPLSETGQKQARILANRFREIPVDRIIASDYIRAKQTAEAIAQTTGKDIVFTPLLRERKRPSELIGIPYKSNESAKFYRLLIKNRMDPSYHFSDEENFFDAVKRAKKFIKLLETYKEKNTAVVSHGAFIKFILAVLIYGDKLNPDIYDPFYMFFVSKNTGITLCEKRAGEFGEDHGKTGTRWHIVTWNDHAHLG